MTSNLQKIPKFSLSLLARPVTLSSALKKKKRKDDPIDILLSKACAQLEKEEDQFDTTGKTKMLAKWTENICWEVH